MFRPLVTAVSYLIITLTVPYTATAAVNPPAVTVAAAKGQNSAENTATSDGTAAHSQQNVQDKEAEKRKLITSEAMSAVSETKIALKALDDGKKDDALAALERATGKLDIILARDPKIALAPMNVSEVTTAILADEAKVMELRMTAERLLAAGQVQLARHILQGLASETVISVSNIPLGTYPDALKQAAKLVDDGKPEEAKKVLQTALNTLVVTNTVIPLPIVATQEFLQNAKQLAENPKRSVDENKNLSDDLTGARKQLAYAEALGYGTKSDFKNLNDQLTEIEDKTEDGKSGTGFFTNIESFLSSLVASSQSADAKQPAPQSHGESASLK